MLSGKSRENYFPTWLVGLAVMNFSGQPQFVTSDAKPLDLKNNLRVTEDVRIETRAGDLVTIKVNTNWRVTVFPESFMQVQGGHPNDEDRLQTFDLKKGRFYFALDSAPRDAKFSTAKKIGLKEKKTASPAVLPSLIQKSWPASADDSKIQGRMQSADATAAEKRPPRTGLNLRSAFFDWTIAKENALSLFIDLDLRTARVKVCNFGIKFDVTLLDHEKPQTLGPDEGIVFQGVPESGEVAYDILLEGRKVPKGRWLAKEPCLLRSVTQLQTDLETRIKKEKRSAEIKKAKAQALKKKAFDASLCHDPLGQLNQCHYILKGNTCVRTRCNAEGEWSDGVILSREKNSCPAGGAVRACDY